MNHVVHSRNMKIFFTRLTPASGPLRGTAGQGLFLNFAYQTATGAPGRGRRQSSCLRERVAAIPVNFRSDAEG